MSKKEILVKWKGLNELGVQEVNEFYKDNIKVGYCDRFELGDNLSSRKSKRIKQTKGFGPETTLYTVDLKQHIIGDKSGGFWFKVKVKHVECDVFEVEVNEVIKAK